MKKTVIVNIPMTAPVQNIVYVSDDASLPASKRAVGYPVISLLEEIMQPEDEVKIVLIAKTSKYSMCEQRIEEFKQQMEAANDKAGAKLIYEVLYSDFSESRDVHEQLMAAIVEHIDPDAEVITDITYGPKDLPIVVFAALNFAERFLNCKIEHIIYGLGIFNEEGKLEDTKICDLSPLYALSGLTNKIKCDSPEKAKEILNSIISL